MINSNLDNNLTRDELNILIKFEVMIKYFFNDLNLMAEIWINQLRILVAHNFVFIFIFHFIIHHQSVIFYFLLFFNNIYLFNLLTFLYNLYFYYLIFLVLLLYLFYSNCIRCLRLRLCLLIFQILFSFLLFCYFLQRSFHF